MNPSKLKVTELRAELAARGLDTKGNKPVLVERLQEALDKESNNEADEPSEGANNSSDIANESELYVTSSEEAGEEQKSPETSEEQKADFTQEVEEESEEAVEEPMPVAPPSPVEAPPTPVAAPPTPVVAPTPSRERKSRFTDREDLPLKQEEPTLPKEAEEEELQEIKKREGGAEEEEEEEEEERMQVDQAEEMERDSEEKMNRDSQDSYHHQQNSGEDSKMFEDNVEVKKENYEDGPPTTDNGVTEDVKIKTEPTIKEEKREDSRSGRDDRKRKRSSSPHNRDWSGPGNNRSFSREEEPDLKDSDVALSWYDSDLNLIIDKETLSIGSPMSDAGFGYIWAGVRGTHGYTKGKVCYEVKLIEFCDVSHLEDEPNPNVLRVGWSALGTSMQLGEEPLSYGYGGTGKASVNCKFKDYGKTFGLDDVVTAYLEFSDEQAIISYAVNGDYLGEAFRLPEDELKGKALAPHILTKNVRFEVNFGQKEEPWFPIVDGFTLVNQVPLEDAIQGPRRPEKRSECEMIMMCGLPGSGKTFWASDYCASNPDKMYNVLGTNALIDKMKVMGLPRKANYHGRWDLLIEKCTKCLQRLMDMGSRRRRNYILDQTNVYPTAQRRKMRNFEGFIRKAVVIVPTDEEFKRRVEQREKEEGKDVPDSAVMEMKANFSLPDKNLFNEVIYTELDEVESKKLVRKYNDEATSAGFVRKGPGGGGPAPKRFRSDMHGPPPRHDFRGGPQRSGPPPHHQGGGGYNRNRGPPGGGGGGRGGWPPRQGGGGDRWGGRDNRSHGGGGYGGGGRQNDRPPAGWRGNSMGGGGGGGGRGPPRDFGGPDRRGGPPPHHGGGGYEGRSGGGGRGPSGGGGGRQGGGGGGYGARGGPPDRVDRGPSNMNKRGGGGHMGGGGGGGGHGGGTSGGSISSTGSSGGGWGAGGGYGGGGGTAGAQSWGGQGSGGGAQVAASWGQGGTTGGGQTTPQAQWGGYTGQQAALNQQQQQWKGYNQTGYNQAATGYGQQGYGQQAYGNWGQYGYNYGQGWSQNADGTYNYPQNWNWYAQQQQQQQQAAAGTTAASTAQPPPAK